MAVYPRHKALVDAFVARGDVIERSPTAVGIRCFASGTHALDAV
jgi:hypothetical protein